MLFIICQGKLTIWTKNEHINTLSLRYKLGFLHYSTVIEAANAGNEIALVNHKIICKYKEKRHIMIYFMFLDNL